MDKISDLLGQIRVTPILKEDGDETFSWIDENAGKYSPTPHIDRPFGYVVRKDSSSGCGRNP